VKIVPDQSVLDEFIDKEDASYDLRPQTAPADGEPKEAIKALTDNQLWDIMKVAPADKLNTQGYVDMKWLDAELESRGVEKITGTRRKQITDLFKPKP
jgi:hypothetical protein